MRNDGNGSLWRSPISLKTETVDRDESEEQQIDPRQARKKMIGNSFFRNMSFIRGEAVDWVDARQTRNGKLVAIHQMMLEKRIIEESITTDEWTLRRQKSSRWWQISRC